MLLGAPERDLERSVAGGVTPSYGWVSLKGGRDGGGEWEG